MPWKLWKVICCGIHTAGFARISMFCRNAEQVAQPRGEHRHRLQRAGSGRAPGEEGEVGMLLGQQHLDELNVDLNLAGRAIHCSRQHGAPHATLKTSARRNPPC